jgi:O-antigen ligase
MASSVRYRATARPTTPVVEVAREAPPPGWDLLLGCVAVYIATAVGRVHQLFPILSVIRPALLATVVSIGLYLLVQSGPRRIGRLQSRPTTLLLGLLVWAGLSAPFALNQGVAIRSWIDYTVTVVMALVVAGSVRRVRDVERLIFVYFAATVLYTAIVLSRFQLGSGDWRLGRLYYYDANDLATLIVTAMPLGLYFVLGQRRIAVRVTALISLAVLAVGLIRSGSRGGLVAFLALGVFVLLGFTTIPARARVAGLVVLLTMLSATASDRYWEQMQTLLNPKQDYNLTSDAGRVKIWKRGIGYMAQRPVLGVGMQNFHVAEGTISPLARLQERGVGVRWGAAHNCFVQVAAELGVPGLLLFVGLIGSAVVTLRKTARRARAALPPRRDVARLAQSLTAALVGFSVGSFFLSLAYADMLYMLIALTIGLVKTARATPPTRTYVTT